MQILLPLVLKEFGLLSESINDVFIAIKLFFSVNLSITRNEHHKRQKLRDNFQHRIQLLRHYLHTKIV